MAENGLFSPQWLPIYIASLPSHKVFLFPLAPTKVLETYWPDLTRYCSKKKSLVQGPGLM